MITTVHIHVCLIREYAVCVGGGLYVYNNNFKTSDEIELKILFAGEAETKSEGQMGGKICVRAKFSFS